MISNPSTILVLVPHCLVTMVATHFLQHTGTHGYASYLYAMYMYALTLYPKWIKMLCSCIKHCCKVC